MHTTHNMANGLVSESNQSKTNPPKKIFAVYKVNSEGKLVRQTDYETYVQKSLTNGCNSIGSGLTTPEAIKKFFLSQKKGVKHFIFKNGKLVQNHEDGKQSTWTPASKLQPNSTEEKGSVQPTILPIAKENEIGLNSDSNVPQDSSENLQTSQNYRVLPNNNGEQNVYLPGSGYGYTSAKEDTDPNNNYDYGNRLPFAADINQQSLQGLNETSSLPFENSSIQPYQNQEPYTFYQNGTGSFAYNNLPYAECFPNNSSHDLTYVQNGSNATNQEVLNSWPHKCHFCGVNFGSKESLNSHTLSTHSHITETQTPHVIESWETRASESYENVSDQNQEMMYKNSQLYDPYSFQYNTNNEYAGQTMHPNEAIGYRDVMPNQFSMPQGYEYNSNYVDHSNNENINNTFVQGNILPTTTSMYYPSNVSNETQDITTRLNDENFASMILRDSFVEITSPEELAQRYGLDVATIFDLVAAAAPVIAERHTRNDNGNLDQ